MAGGGPVHIHVAEQTKEVDDCLAFYGARPVEWLLANQDVDARWCLIHATHMTDTETIAMARSGAVAGLCPITEANLGDGIFPAPEFLDAGGAFGVGSDSNLLISLTEELRLLENSQRLKLRTRNVVSRREGDSTGRALFDGALAGGGLAMGLDKVGLVAGASADIVSLDAEHDALFGRPGDALLDGLIFAARTGAIDAVWSQGRKVVTGGRHVARDEVSARFRRVMTKLLT
jgi:formiminoglutamate deiminase